MNHLFVNGNKRIGHAAMEVFLVLNGYGIDASAHEQETVVLSLAAGEKLTEWLRKHIKSIG